MPTALQRPTLDELYRRLRDLDHTQIDERMAVMLNAILQLEDQGECRESATEAVLIVGYTTEGISNRAQTRWLSWNAGGGVRGFDLARNPGLSNNTEHGAGEFPLPTRPTARSTGQSSSKVPSMSRAQQTTEAYPELGVLKKELEKALKERNKANLDRDQAKLDRERLQLERDQAVDERDQTLKLLEMLRAEHQQELKVRENAANRDQLKSELERIEQRQRELDAQKGARSNERVVTSSRPESRMEVDEAPRARGRFNLDREAREHMSEGLEVWIPNDATPSLRNLETQPVRPLMDVVLPGYTPTSTSSGSQVSGASSRLKELGEKLQQQSRERATRPELPPTWREQPVRNVVIASYKKDTEGNYHKHSRLDWNAEQQARRDCFHDAAWVQYLAPPRVPEGAVHLIIGDSLVRVLTQIRSHWQTGVLSFAGAATPQMLATLDMLGMTKVYTVTLMVGTNDVSRGEARKVTRLSDKINCLLEELRIQMDPILLTICTVPYNMMFDQHSLEMNQRVRSLNKAIREIHRNSVLPLRLLDVAERMENKGFPEDTSKDGIHFDRPRGAEWLNDVFQVHINTLEADLLETAQFTLGPPPNPPFLASRALAGRLGARVDTRDSSRSNQTRLQSATPMESEEVESSTPPTSAMSSVVVADGRREKKSRETTRLRYPEKVKELDLETLECRRELAETLGIERVSHEDLNRHHCVDWLKAHEAHFSRTKLMETTDLTGIPTKTIMGPINYRPLKQLGSPGLIAEPPKHRTGIARIKLATPAQLKVVDKLLNPGGMELPDAAHEGPRLAEDPRYGKPCGGTQLAKTLAVYDRADPAAARVIIVAGSDFEGTSPKLFWPETLVYSLPGAELNQMLTLVVAIKSEMPCEPELLLFAGMNDHLHAMGLLEQLKGKEIPTSKKIWEAIQALFAAMNEVQENVASRFGSKTKVVFTTSPGYASMPPALQFVYAVLILIAEGSEWRILMAAPNRELEPVNLRLYRSELPAAWADISHALRGFYGLADVLIVLDEVLLLEISNFARQLKFSPVIGDDHPAINQLTASLWFRSMDVKVANSTSRTRGPSNERRNVVETEKQLESMKYRLTQENGWWPFLTPRLENATNKTREEAPLLVKQIWSFLEKQLELAERRDMTVVRFVSAANEVTIGGFWREHANGELKTRRDYEILKFLSPCWEREFLAGVFGTTATIFGAFVQEILGMPISLLLALYLVYPRYLFNMGPAYMFSRGVETLRVDGYLALVLLTHGELVSFHRLMEYGEPLSMGKVHTSIETSSYKCAAGLKTLLVQYLMMQNRYMTGEDENPTSREEWEKANRGMPLLTDLCLAMRSDPMGIIRGLEEVVTCIYGPAVTYAFPDPLVITYRHSVTHLSLISVLDGAALNWCQQEVLRARMSNTVLFGKVKDAEMMVCNFRGQMQCRMGGKREGPIEMYPKFWNLNPLTADGREILRIPAWKECFALVKRELETIMEKEILPATMPEFPIVRRMTLGMNSPLVVPSIMARMRAEEMQKDFTDGWDPLFIGYTAAVYFHTSEMKVNSWTTQAKKSRGSQPPGYEVRKVLRTLEKEGLDNMLPIWDDGRMIVMEGHVALVDDMKFATRKYKAPYGLEQVEIRQEGTELDAAGQLHVALTEYKKLDPATPSPLSVDTPGDKRSGPVEDRFKRILERRRNESEEESMDETLSEAGEDMEVGNTPEPGPSGEELTTQELLKDLSEENWADTATPPLNPSPRKNLELPLAGETFNMGMLLLSSEERGKNTFEGNRDIFLGSLEDDAWQEFLEEFNREVGSETTLDKFKKELWDAVVRFGEPLLIGTGLDEKARKELLNKLVELRNARSKTRKEKCEDSSTLKQKTVDKMVDDIKRDKVGTSNMIKSTNILKARAGGRQELEGVDGEVESMMIATTPSSRDVKTRKRKREVEGWGSPSVDAVSEGNLRETAPIVLARCKTAAYKNSSELRKPLEVEKEIEVSTSSTSEEDFKPQKVNVKRGSTNGQVGEVEIGKEWISKAHQDMSKQVTSDPLERNKTRNTSRTWWVALETLKEMEDCLKKLDSGIARRRRNWATQQKAEVNKIEMASHLKRSWQSLLKDHFEEAMRTSSSAPPLMANPFVRTAGQLMFTWSLVGIELETLTSYDRLKLGSKKLEVYQALMQHVARDNSGLSLARRKDATCFLRWTMSMMSDSTILACHQRASGSKTMERRVSTIILNVYQSTGIEKEDGSRISLESHRKLDEVRRFSNKKFEEEHDVHRNLASSEQYSRLSEKGEYQYVSGVLGIAYNPFLDSEAGGAHRNHEVAELLKFWTERIMEIDAVEKEGPSLGLILEKTPEVISMPRSNKRVEVNMGGGNGLLTTNLGVIWKLLRPSWCPHPHASLIEETTERVRLAPTEDEDLAKLSVLHKLITPQMQEPSERTSDPGSTKKLEPGSCLDSTCGNGEHICDGRSCVRILSFQKEDLVTWFEDITEREKSEVQIIAECYARTTVNIATALGFFSRMCDLQALERLESEHHLVTALSVESWPGVLQVTQKHIRSWKVGLEAEMGFPLSEAYGLPLNAKSLIGSMMANLCGSHYPLHMAMVEVSSQRILVDKAFSVPKCVRLARMSHHSHKLLRKIKGTVPKELRDDLSEIWGEDLLKLERENTSDHERQNVIGKPVGSTPNLEDNDTMHEKMMELEPLLEASGERNLRSIEISHGECPCHCLAQTVWYPDHKNLCLVWDVEEIRSIGLPDHRQKVTLLVVSTMLALRWIEENITKYREATTPTAESIYAIDYSRRLELFETACKVFAIPTEVRHVWSRLRYFPWFRATLTSWLYRATKDHMKKHQKEYRQFQAEIGPEAFKRPLLTHRNAITTGWKRVGKMSRDNTKARESILEEDLAKNVSLSLHNSFCLNREARVKALPNQAKRLQEQREWMRSYEQLKAWEEIVISSDDEEELLRQFAASSTSGCSTSKAKSTR